MTDNGESPVQQSDHGHKLSEKDERRQRVRAQVDVILNAFGGEVEVYGYDEEAADYGYFYRTGSLLVRDRDLARVVDSLEDRSGETHGLVNGLTRLEVADHVPDLLDELDAKLGIGVATPDHVLHVARNARICPASEPEETDARGPHPPMSSRARDGQGVLVSVVDTGWHPPAGEAGSASPWLAGVTGDDEVNDPSGLRSYAGHGTFVAGVVKCAAPAAEVRVEGFLTRGGAILEADMVVQLHEALAAGPDIINLSAGTRTRSDVPALSFDTFWENELRHVKGTVLVAAAGNEDTREPFWPAAFPWAVSVGAVDADDERAGFSNYGSWVDVYALGVDLVNAFPHGRFVPIETADGEERHFAGLARWSGTSFSAPLVSGMIAAEMSRAGLSARDAADALLERAKTYSKPGVGPLL